MSAWSKSLLIILLTAAAYLNAARLGLALAMPPAYKATAVWPASGIALAALLLFGSRAWPGIFLGAFIANFWDYFSSSTFSLSAHLAVSASIAVASTAQALFCAFLLKRWIGNEGPLDRSANVFRFVGIVPFACVVAATIGVTTMVLAGFAQWADYSFNWWTWWLGDTVGILVITPLILVLGKPLNILWNPERLLQAAVLIAFLLADGFFVFAGWNPFGPFAKPLPYMVVPLVV